MIADRYTLIPELLRRHADEHSAPSRALLREAARVIETLAADVAQMQRAERVRRERVGPAMDALREALGLYGLD